MSEFFINPYAFLPFPTCDHLDRKKPQGHAAPAPGAVHGVIEFEIEAVTPLLVRWPGDPVGALKVYTAPRTTSPDGGSVYFLPGSGLHGALRSLHESLAGGCLRVFDREFLPTYRDQMMNLGSEWALSVVTEVHHGRPVSFTRSDLYEETHRTAWINLSCFPAPPTTGDRFMITLGPEREVAGRFEYDQAVVTPGGGDWVVLLTDAGGRFNAHSYYVAAGRVAPGSAPAPVDPQGWADFLTGVRDSNDMRGVAAGPGDFDPAGSALSARVVFHGLSCQRHVLRPWVYPGQVFWTRVPGEVITEIRPAVIWRHLGGDAVAATRTLQTLWSCETADSLCPSCRVFGSAETEVEQGQDQDRKERARRHADQQSYRGHVRVGDAGAAGEAQVSTTNIDLAPLGRPRLGAGQFSLVRPKGVYDAYPGRPAREWGSVPDQGQARPLRGRKYYWRTTDSPGRERHRRRPHNSAEVSSRAEVFSAGATFNGRLSFENLTPTDLGSIVASLRPDLLFACSGSAGRTRPPGHDEQTEQFTVPIGGAKPFGFGSCVIRITRLTLVDPVTRYRAGEPTTVTAAADLKTDLETALDETDLETDLTARVAEFVAAAPHWLHNQWDDLARLLRLDHVDGSIVWYPPGASWADRGAGAQQRFDKPFTFWRNTVGGFRVTDGQAVDVRPLYPLPGVAAQDQRVRINGREPAYKVKLPPPDDPVWDTQ